MKIELEISDDKIRDEFTYADIGYWVDRRSCSFAVVDGLPHWTIAVQKALNPDKDSYTVLPENIKAGLKIMAEKYGRHFADFVTGTGDATTGDILVQLSAFGELLYG